MKRFLLAVVVFFASFGAFAGHLSPAQLQTLKQDINTNFLAQWNSQDIAAIVSAYNAPASPTFVVWKSTLDATAYRDSITWTEFTGRSAGERDMFSLFTNNGTASIMCSKANARQAINDAFSGASGVNSRNALTAACKRTVSRIERLFATGTGSDATPGQLVVELVMDESTIIEAMGQ